MQYVVRYNLKTGKAADYRQWLLDNADNLSRGDRQGWRYLDTHFAVMGFGDYDCETRWQVDDYAALGSPMSEMGGKIFKEWLEFVDTGHMAPAVLLKSAAEVVVFAE